MSKKNISQEKIIQAFLTSAFDKSAGATSLADVADSLEIKKASLYNHFESREAMYDASIAYCEKEIGQVDFLTQKVLDSVKAGKTTIPAAIKNLLPDILLCLIRSLCLRCMFLFIQSSILIRQP